MLTGSGLYWDASAVLSLLFRDEHTNRAQIHASREAVHIVSSLTYAQVYAVISRLHRSGTIDSQQATSARERFDRGPWNTVSVQPQRRIIQRLSQRWGLKGADLWHLGVAFELRAESQIKLLSYDPKLVQAARAENLSAN